MGVKISVAAGCAAAHARGEVETMTAKADKCNRRSLHSSVGIVSMETASDPERSQLELEGIEWARTHACVAVIHLERL